MLRLSAYFTALLPLEKNAMQELLWVRPQCSALTSTPQQAALPAQAANGEVRQDPHGLLASARCKALISRDRHADTSLVQNIARNRRHYSCLANFGTSMVSALLSSSFGEGYQA